MRGPELERLYDEHAQPLYAFLLNLTRDEADTRDLLQEIFVKLARDPKLLDEDGKLMLFDRVLANPPFSLEDWGREVAASDAYFPFADGLLVLADAGVRAIAEPGGSVRDAEVIEAAERAGVSLYFTGVRHFWH